jgi:hypothetical protein
MAAKWRTIFGWSFPGIAILFTNDLSDVNCLLQTHGLGTWSLRELFNRDTIGIVAISQSEVSAFVMPGRSLDLPINEKFIAGSFGPGLEFFIEVLPPVPLWLPAHVPVSQNCDSPSCGRSALRGTLSFPDFTPPSANYSHVMFTPRENRSGNWHSFDGQSNLTGNNVVSISSTYSPECSLQSCSANLRLSLRENICFLAPQPLAVFHSCILLRTCQMQWWLT